MITGPQLTKLISDYGPTVAFIVFIVLFIIALIVGWKFISKFVTAINNIIAMPARLDEQDKVASQKVGMIEGLQRDLKKHVTEAEGYIQSIDVLKKEVAAIAMQQQDIVHEVKPNSGSSMKDALDRIEKKILPALVEQVDALATRTAAAAEEAATAAGAATIAATGAAVAAAEAKAARPHPRSRRRSADSTQQP